MFQFSIIFSIPRFDLYSVVVTGQPTSSRRVFGTDNKLVPILDVDNNTEAGGGNVFMHDVVRKVLVSPDSPFEALPNGANMRVDVRRTTPIGDNAGLPLEDLGVLPDETCQMTRNDLMNGNADLLNDAARALSVMQCKAGVLDVNKDRG